MRVVVYNIQEFEKQTLAKANAKVHDLTLISNPLNLDTIRYAEGKEVVIVSENDNLEKTILDALKRIGVKKIITRSVSLNHIDLAYAGHLGLHVANTPAEDDSPKSIAMQTIQNLNSWVNNKCLGVACHCAFDCSKKSSAIL
ncbi:MULTISPECIES: lactate dehydrogenase [Sphingobacterium]|jgi:lactate dehydrogenase-like 2-hydroxyacid dehydrogenase|uniref:Lactate dehydrogenase n=1 Tax=Sphingobacterium litopenaei TaxID=2763500 RepID=A0ABR7YHG5_9SPHI|nr:MULTISPECIES: lactate dehydrogenase [Sphingobacterium]MBD1430757.1 lactate dehydrogenase [Sphingobacterium litopenaei]NGM74048.1 lactate dehydrogenase [Sphingobacterium sp. SGL-16]